MGLEVTLSNAVVPVIQNDDYDGANNELFSVYQNVPFSIDLTFVLTDEGNGNNNNENGNGNNSIIPITSIVPSFTQYSNVTFTTVNNSQNNYVIRVSGTLADVIPGGQYTVVMGDKSLKTFSPTNLPKDYYEVVEWSLPTYYSKSINNYSFNVNSNTVIYNMNQRVYWNLNQEIQRFRQAVAKGN